MTYFILTKNGRANRRLSARLKAMDLTYRVEKIGIGQYVYTFTDPDKGKWKQLKDILGTDERDFIWNDHERPRMIFNLLNEDDGRQAVGIFNTF